MFVINLKYIASIEKVNEIRPNHIKFLDKFYNEKKFLASGRKYDQSGGIIISLSESEDEVIEIMKNDPFIINKIATYELIGFSPTKNLNIIDGLIRR